MVRICKLPQILAWMYWAQLSIFYENIQGVDPQVAVSDGTGGLDGAKPRIGCIESAFSHGWATNVSFLRCMTWVRSFKEHLNECVCQFLCCIFMFHASLLPVMVCFQHWNSTRLGLKNQVINHLFGRKGSLSFIHSLSVSPGRDLYIYYTQKVAR